MCRLQKRNLHTRFFIVITKTLLYNTCRFGGNMKDKLTKEEVLHVLDLARLEASGEEIEKYQVELFKMLKELDKIKELNDFSEDLIIAPWTNETSLRENDSLEIQEGDILKNVPSKKGNFISVEVEVLKDE